MPKFILLLLRIIIPFALLAAGFVVAQHLMKTGPEAKKRPPIDRTPVVEVQKAQQQDYTITLTSSGVVRTHSQTNLVLQVSGRVVSLSPSFYAGGYIKKGELLLQLDTTDTEDAIHIAKSTIASNKAQLAQLNQEEKNSHSSLRLSELNLRSIRKNLIISRANHKNVERNGEAIRHNIVLIQRQLQLTQQNVQLAKRNFQLGVAERNRVQSLWNERLVARNVFDAEEQKVIQLEQSIVQQEQSVIQQEQSLAQQEQSLIQHDQNLLTAEQQVLQQEQAINQQLQSIDTIKGQIATYESRREALKANLAISETQLTQQERNKVRARIHAPFNGRVLEKQVGIGQYLSPNSTIGTIYAADFVEVDIPLTLTQFELLNLPEHMQAALKPDNKTSHNKDYPVSFRMPFGTKKSWEGYITGTRAQLDNQSRQIIVVARIEQQQEGSTQSTLKIGQFLTSQLKGQRFENIYRLPTSAIRQNREVLLLKKGTVRILPIEVVWNTETEAIIKSNEDINNQRIIVTPLPQASDGMKVSLVGAKKRRRDAASGKRPQRKEP